MIILIGIISEHGTEAIALLSYEDPCSIRTSPPFYLAVEFKSFQIHLKHLKEEGLHSIDDSTDYSSID